MKGKGGVQYAFGSWTSMYDFHEFEVVDNMSTLEIEAILPIVAAEHDLGMNPRHKTRCAVTFADNSSRTGLPHWI